jgi:hypothetical protein
MKVIVDLLSLAIGIIIYHLITGQDVVNAFPNIYWCLFGGSYVSIKHKVWKESKDT